MGNIVTIAGDAWDFCLKNQDGSIFAMNSLITNHVRPSQNGQQTWFIFPSSQINIGAACEMYPELWTLNFLT